MKNLSVIFAALFLVLACNSEEVNLIDIREDELLNGGENEEILDGEEEGNVDGEFTVWEEMQSTSVLSALSNKNAIELHRFYENKGIDVLETTEIGDIPVYDVELIDDKYTVFKYTYFYKDDPEVVDDEYAANIYFQVDSDLDSFTIEGEEALKKGKAVIKQFCFCPVEYANPSYLENISISGEKTDEGAWNISVNCETTDYKIVTIEGSFEYSDYEPAKDLGQQ